MMKDELYECVWENLTEDATVADVLTQSIENGDPTVMDITDEDGDSILYVGINEEEMWIESYGERVFTFHLDPEVIDIQDVGEMIGDVICRFF